MSDRFFVLSGPMYLSLSLPRADLRKCRSRRLFYEKPFYRSSSNNTERRVSVCPRIPFSPSYTRFILADRVAPGRLFPTQLDDSSAALKWVTLLLQDVPTPPLNLLIGHCECRLTFHFSQEGIHSWRVFSWRHPRRRPIDSHAR